jgi:hypothetical protein
MHPKNRIILLAVAWWLAVATVTAQSASIIDLPGQDVLALKKADDRSEATRFSAPVKLDLAPAAAPDTYAFLNGEWTWSRTFRLPGTNGLALFADQLDLPEGGRLELTNDNGRQGPFYQADASRNGRLFTDFLPGEEVTITYRGPLPETTPFHLWRIDHVYRPDRWQVTPDKGFGDGNPCQVNANCAAGDGWADEKSGTGRINLVVEEGVGFCSGNLINNTALDGRPYLLTGFHCMDGFTPIYELWSVDFDYTSDGCDNPAEEPAFTRYIGVEFRAGLQATDFMLLEITDTDFAAEDHFFAGWDRSAGNVAAPVRHFHHPFGDIQKLGVSDSDGAIILTNRITWNSGVITPPSHHFVLDYAVGDYMVGSSGSCFFDNNRRIRGTLNGGSARCPGISEAFIGRFHLSWDTGTVDSTRLRPWLDPLDTNPMTLDGANLLTKLYATGTVVDRAGAPLEAVTIVLQWAGGGRAEFVTDAQGRYFGERPSGVTAFAVSGVYEGSGLLEENVDVGDIIAIRRHVLTLDTLSPVAQLAGDVNGSGTIRVSDITVITRVILGVGDWGVRPNWMVLPVGFPLSPIPASPGAPIGISLNQPNERELVVNFFVTKTGNAAE